MGSLTPVWHDVECAAYTADLELWRALADTAHGPVLDLGCGTGRIALDLASRGREVTGIDADAELIESLRSRARERDLDVNTAVADARSFDLGARFALVISPMQVVQLLGGPDGRAQMLAAVHRHLRPGGLFAAALANPFDDWSDTESLPPLPDVREEDGWVYSSTPVGVRWVGDGFAIERNRQAVSPSGEISEERSTIKLDSVTADALEAEGRGAGFEPRRRLHVAPTAEYVGSDVVLLEAT